MADSKYLKPTSILLPPELKATLLAEAQAESRSLSAHIVHLLKGHTEKTSAAYVRAVQTPKSRKSQ